MSKLEDILYILSYIFDGLKVKYTFNFQIYITNYILDRLKSIYMLRFMIWVNQKPNIVLSFKYTLFINKKIFQYFMYYVLYF